MWAFVDYENVGCLSAVDLSIYERIIIFLGAKQPKLDFGGTKYDKPLNITLIQIKTTSLNNLDFHLSYYLGKFDSETDKEVAFDVVSNDNGFVPLIVHIKQNGRTCKQVKSSTETEMVIHKPKETIDLKARLMHSLKSRSKDKRPQKVSSLRNHIASQLQVQGNDLMIQNYYNQLIADKYIKVSGDSVEYKC